MSWRVAKSLDKLLSQINNLAPNRSTISDGSIGDPSHSSRESDHNPNALGVVCARDFTHDPMTGADMGRIMESLRKSKDKRIKYAIWDNRMFSSYPTSTFGAFTWRPYSGSNPHTKHAHVSVERDYDNTKTWAVPKPERKWHLTATKNGKAKAVVKDSWPAARDWIRDLAKKGWRVVARKK